MEQLDEGGRIWLLNFARKNLWRIPSWYGLDSLVQDGYMVYYRVLRRYCDKVKNKSHMMALFKTSFTNHIHDLSKVKMRYNEVEFTDDIASKLTEDSCEGVSEIVMSAPAPVQGLIRAMTTEQGLKKLRKPYRARKRGDRETTNERWCRIAGVSSRGIDLPAMVKASITGGMNDNHQHHEGI